MNPSNQAQAPISRVQTDNSRLDLIELASPGQQALCKRSIMRISGRKQKQEWESRAATHEGMHPEAAQERARMVGRSMPIGGIRISASPCQDGSTINDQVASSNES